MSEHGKRSETLGISHSVESNAKCFFLSLRIVPLLFGVCAISIVAPVAGARAEPKTVARYVIFEIDADDEISLVHTRDVELASDLQTEDLGGPAHKHEPGKPSARRRDRIVVTLLGQNETRLFRKTIDVDRDVRSEFPGGDGEIVRRQARLDKTAFVVRLPRGGRDIEVFMKRTSKSRRFPTSSDSTLAAAMEIYPPLATLTGSPANRVDILLLGDGYTSAESSKFQADADATADGFLAITPYQEYAGYVNVTTHFVASPQSGADHPPCSDPDKSPDPAEGTYVNTAFDATYCAFGIQRLLTVSNSKVMAAASSVPDWDIIIVIVNDTMYGGAGGGTPVTSQSPYSINILRHEWGHTFGDLADEYTMPYPGFTACNDSSGPACEANVTTQTARAAIKWNPWIAAVTPVPTPESYTTVVGLFAGARYQTSGYSRPKYDCLMNHLEVPYCEVCRQEYVLKLYRGWGGVPASGIDIIEPGTESPAVGTVAGAIGTASTFGATVLGPAGGPSPAIQWRVNNVVQGSTTTSMSYTSSSSGSHTVIMRVTDVTPFVNTTMAGTDLQSSRTWTLTVGNATTPANFVATATSSQVQLSWALASGAATYQIARSTGGTFSTLASTAGTSYTDMSVSVGSAYIYKVRAFDSNNVATPYSTPDLVTVFVADDDPLAVESPVKAIHLTQLRTAINAARTVAGLAAATYSQIPAAGLIVRAADVQEMRNALNAARTAIGMAAYSFTDATLTVGSTTIKKAHVVELRAAVR